MSIEIPCVAGDSQSGRAIAKVTGALLPIVLEKMHIDPALSGSVILTTVTDAVGFFTLLGLATWYLL